MRAVVFLLPLLLLSPPLAAAAVTAPSSSTAHVVTLRGAHRHVRLAAAELRRYLGLVEGGGARPALAEVASAAELDALLLAGGAQVRRTVLVATAAEAAAAGLGVAAPAAAGGGGGGAYTLSSPRDGLASVVGSDALHALYGAYTLLESVGCTFSTAGATHPLLAAASWRAFERGFRQDDTPAFTTRGLQPFHDFMVRGMTRSPCARRGIPRRHSTLTRPLIPSFPRLLLPLSQEGPDWWGEDETKRVIESIVTMKGNLIGFRVYSRLYPAHGLAHLPETPAN